MKRSEAAAIIEEKIRNTGNLTYELSFEIIDALIDGGFKPPQFINPEAKKRDPDIFDNGEKFAIFGYYDKYPSYYFEGKRQRPYEFYLEGWEDET